MFMGIFNKKQTQKESDLNTKKVSLSSNELNEEELLNVAGGRDYHTEGEKLANVDFINSLVKQPR